MAEDTETGYQSEAHQGQAASRLLPYPDYGPPSDLTPNQQA
jgi:hypothetical protein